MRKWVYSRGKGRYIPPRHEFDVMVTQAYPDYMSRSAEDTHLTIRRIMGFELHGHYETWSHSCIAEDEDFRVQGEWIDEVLERVCFLRSNPGEAKSWERKEREGASI